MRWKSVMWVGQRVRPLVFQCQGVEVGRGTDAGVEVRDEVEDCHVGGSKSSSISLSMSISDTGVEVGRDTDAGVEVRDKVEECRVGGSKSLSISLSMSLEE